MSSGARRRKAKVKTKKGDLGNWASARWHDADGPSFGYIVIVNEKTGERRLQWYHSAPSPRYTP